MSTHEAGPGKMEGSVTALLCRFTAVGRDGRGTAVARRYIKDDAVNVYLESKIYRIRIGGVSGIRAVVNRFDTGALEDFNRKETNRLIGHV